VGACIYSRDYSHSKTLVLCRVYLFAVNAICNLIAFFDIVMRYVLCFGFSLSILPHEFGYFETASPGFKRLAGHIIHILPKRCLSGNCSICQKPNYGWHTCGGNWVVDGCSERSWLEQGNTVGENVVPLARNFGSAELDLESNTSLIKVKFSLSSFQSSELTVVVNNQDNHFDKSVG
jgi:hypothetical protein